MVYGIFNMLKVKGLKRRAFRGDPAVVWDTVPANVPDSHVEFHEFGATAEVRIDEIPVTFPIIDVFDELARCWIDLQRECRLKALKNLMKRVSWF